MLSETLIVSVALQQMHQGQTNLIWFNILPNYDRH